MTVGKDLGNGWRDRIMLEYFKELNGYKRKCKFVTYVVVFVVLGIPLYIASEIGGVAEEIWGYIGTHMRSWVRA